jgi:hypothetical protein
MTDRELATLAVAIVGAFTGVLGLGLSIVVYRRDRASVRVRVTAHFAELATPVRAKWPPWIGVLATPSEAASAADAGRPLHPLILTSFRFVAR